MKKLLSVLLSFVMVITCFGFGSLTASADTLNRNYFKYAKTITVSAPLEMTLDSEAEAEIDTMALLKFVAPETKYYEFVSDTIPEKGYVMSMVIANDSKENCYSGTGAGGVMNGKKRNDFIVAAKLTRGHTYYILFEGKGCGQYTANVHIRSHTHKFDSAYSYPAYIDEEYGYSSDGGKWLPCIYCNVERTEESYYAPKTMVLSTYSCYYKGTERVPKVTIKDRKGNVIPASEYKVICKNNVKPGKATVTVTFNGKKYKGQMVKTFIIKPNSMGTPKVSSPKSKQLKVNWIRNGNVSGYYVQYSTSPKFPGGSSTKGVFIGKNTIGTTTISKLKPGKKYYVRMRAFKTVDGKNYHGSWSKTSSVTVRK